MLAQNVRVLAPGRVFAVLLAFALAGCATDQASREAERAIWPSVQTPPPPVVAETQTPPPVVPEPRPPTPTPAPITPPVAQAPLVQPPPPVVIEPLKIEVPAPAIAVTNHVTETWIPLNRWCANAGLGLPARVNGAPSLTYSISSTNGVLLLRPWSQVAHWNGLEMRLGFAPQLIDGQPVVHALDLGKSIRPLLVTEPKLDVKFNSENRAEASFAPVLVIDPGHGGENAGTKSVLGQHYEKEFTLDWARRLRALLVTNGWQVFLTRTNDSDLALSNRVAVAEAHRADLFLSLHFNSAAPNETQAGLETYCLTPQGMPSTVTRGFDDDPLLVFPNNAFDAQNLRLALRVHRALLHVNGDRDRGVRHARYLGVLRGQTRPAVLVEGGYLSNPHEARLIGDPGYRERLAEALAKALAEEMGIKPNKQLVTLHELGAGRPEPIAQSRPAALKPAKPMAAQQQPAAMIKVAPFR